MSSDEEYMPDEEESDASSGVSSDEESSDFIASDDDDESSESNDDVSYDQPELESEDDGSNTNQYTTPRKSRQCTIETNEKIHEMLKNEELSDNEVLKEDTQDVVINLSEAPSSNLDAPSSKKKLRTTRYSSRRRKRKLRMHYCEEESNDNIIIGGTRSRKRGRGSNKNLDSVFAFHGTSSEEEDNQLPIPVTRSSKKSRRCKRMTSDSGNGDDEGMGSLSRGSLQNEFDIDSSDGIESIEHHENQSSKQEESEVVDSSDEGESSEEPNKKGMGSKDLYCCPLCYAEAYRRQGNLGGNMDRDDSSVESESSSDGSDRKVAADPFLFSDDPMTILINIGLETAATFCFETLGGVDKYIDMGVKDHMEIIHRIDSSALVDNELFQRFKIRDGDSLLQRWLRARAGTPGQKDMQDYWLRDGNNDQFNHLARMVHKIHRQMMHSGKFAWETFSESFPNRAKKLWNKLSDPHLRRHEDDAEESNQMDDDEVIEQQVEYMPPPVLPGDEESDAEEYIAQHLPNLSDPVRRERYSQELQEERDANDGHVSDEAASNNISFLASDHSNNCDFVAMADGTWKSKDDEDSISSLSKEENESEEESDSSENDSADESSKEEQDEWMKERMMKPAAAREKERSIRQNDNSSNSDEDDSLRPSHTSPYRAEFGGDLVDTDDEQPARMQPRRLDYSEKKKKRKRILDDSDDES